MLRLLDPVSFAPIITVTDKLPVPGSYFALITDSVMHLIEPLYEDQETCLAVSYRLVNTATLDVYEFTETYFPYKDNPRTEDFLAFLRSNGYDFMSDDKIIGLRATVNVVYEVLGGMAHPILSFRPWGISQAFQGCSDDELPF